MCAYSTAYVTLVYLLQIGRAPLHFAAMHGHAEIVKILLADPLVDPNDVDEVSVSMALSLNSSGGGVRCLCASLCRRICASPFTKLQRTGKHILLLSFFLM